MDTLLAAMTLVMQPAPLLALLAGAMFGLFVGAIPGLSATMATALLVPVTFFMDPLPAMALIVSSAAMAICAGDIPATLLRIPGTPASAAYTDEAHALTRNGKADAALGTLLFAAAFGGLFGSIVLMTLAPVLASFAIRFSAFEYFWLALLGLSCVVLVSGNDPVKAAVALVCGMILSTIGLDTMSGQPRFTFGSVELMGGVSFIPVMIGVFAASAVIRALVKGPRAPGAALPAVRGGILRNLASEVRPYRFGFLRGSFIGTAIGILPGAGGDLAAWISYALSRRMSRTPEAFGKGHVEGLVDAGASNNAGLSGAWVPALVFGIPGDAITAIALGVLLMKGLNPGPTLFAANAPLLYAVFFCFLLANLLLVPLGLLAIRVARPLLRVPQTLLMPVILLFCIVGAFAINNTVFGIAIMLVFGIIGYTMEENGFPVAPLILGLILGPLVERTLSQASMIARGDILPFFERPVSLVLGIIAISVWALILVKAVRGARTPPPDPQVSKESAK
jgi:TctA family transporter